MLKHSGCTTTLCNWQIEIRNFSKRVKILKRAKFWVSDWLKSSTLAREATNSLASKRARLEHQLLKITLNTNWVRFVLIYANKSTPRFLYKKVLYSLPCIFVQQPVFLPYFEFFQSLCFVWTEFIYFSESIKIVKSLVTENWCVGRFGTVFNPTQTLFERIGSGHLQVEKLALW